MAADVVEITAMQDAREWFKTKSLQELSRDQPIIVAEARKKWNLTAKQAEQLLKGVMNEKKEAETEQIRRAVTQTQSDSVAQEIVDAVKGKKILIYDMDKEATYYIPASPNEKPCYTLVHSGRSFVLDSLKRLLGEDSEIFPADLIKDRHTVFEPSQPFGFVDGKLNTYRPRFYPPELKDVVPDLPTIVDEFMVHLIPKKEAREYAYDWLARCVHHVKRPPTATGGVQSMLVMIGVRSIGKGRFAELTRALIDPEYVLAMPDDLMTGYTHATASLQGKLFCHAEEFQVPERKDVMAIMENQLKLLSVTSSVIPINPKGRPAGSIKNNVSFLLQQNTDQKIIPWPRDDVKRYAYVGLTDVELQYAPFMPRYGNDIGTWSNVFLSEAVIKPFWLWLKDRAQSLPDSARFKPYIDRDYVEECEDSAEYDGWWHDPDLVTSIRKEIVERMLPEGLSFSSLSTIINKHRPQGESREFRRDDLKALYPRLRIKRGSQKNGTMHRYFLAD